MLSRYIHAIHTEDPGLEEPAATRERLKERFPRGATRRMTQPGLLIAAALADLAPGEDDTLVYASCYAESRALESYLDSFPTPSPTLFQTSIHPGSVQQAFIGRQQPVRHFFPHTGRPQLVVHAVQTALLAPTPRTILCGGEERGTWLREQRAASDRTFAFALLLTPEPAGALGNLSLAATDDTATERFLLPAFFDALHARQAIDITVASGARLTLAWS
ncbi:MAG TPA: hypothetical protein VNV14_00395 [Opitutaceae bacterium]|nr:hypothetical protein [Opitutaceae bacterium]